LPSSHSLESWNDAAPQARLESLCQPLVSPLFDTRQEAESLLVWARRLAKGGQAILAYSDFHDFLRQRWTAELGGVPSTLRGTPRPAVAVPIPVPATQPATQATSAPQTSPATHPAPKELKRYPPTAAETAWQQWLRAGWRGCAAAA
jgi:hypothetical protein